MDYFPVPVPVIQAERTGSIKRTLCGLDINGNVTAGQKIIQDCGGIWSDIEFNFDGVTQTTITALDVLFAKVEPILYSPNDGTDVWKLAWLPEKAAYNPIKEAGRDDYILQMKFTVLEKTV